MTSRQRSAWIRLASILVVFIPYFLYVLKLFESGQPIGRPLCVAFLVAALAHGLLNGVAQGISSSPLFGREFSDERDRAIDALSLRIAYYVLIVLLLVALSTLAALGFFTVASEDGTIPMPGYSATSQFVFVCVVLAEASRHVTQVWCYRRGAA
jgi:hypothetical protein